MDFTGSYEAAVSERAYEIYLMRMKFGIGGDTLSDWLTAEREWRSTAAKRAGASMRVERGSDRRTTLVETSK